MHIFLCLLYFTVLAKKKNHSGKECDIFCPGTVVSPSGLLPFCGSCLSVLGLALGLLLLWTFFFSSVLSPFCAMEWNVLWKAAPAFSRQLTVLFRNPLLFPILFHVLLSYLWLSSCLPAGTAWSLLSASSLVSFLKLSCTFPRCLPFLIPNLKPQICQN